MWDRNIQLALYGILFGLAQIVFFSPSSDRSFAAAHGWLGGYSSVTVLVVLLSSLGGILVSLVVVYLDNIIRGFATSGAILLTAAVSYHMFHDVVLNGAFVCGAATVLISVFNYQDVAAPSAVAPSPRGHYALVSHAAAESPANAAPGVATRSASPSPFATSTSPVGARTAVVMAPDEENPADSGSGSGSGSGSTLDPLVARLHAALHVEMQPMTSSSISPTRKQT